MTAHLNRALAPITERAWQRLEEEARQLLVATLAARKVVDFVGPSGWDTSSVDIGRARVLDEPPVRNITAAIRVVQPLVEIRAPFKLSRAEIDAAGRGARDIDLEPLRDAARIVANAEESTVFYGYPAADIEGICKVSAANSIDLPEAFEDMPDAIAGALEGMRTRGVGGPFALLLGPEAHEDLLKATHRGVFPVVEHVKDEIDGPIVRAPILDGGLLVSMRGGDFELTVGQDFSIGYSNQTAQVVDLYLEESFTFIAISPEAAAPLRYRR
jgi:uncharacterized linocin/CFP29 family protein